MRARKRQRGTLEFNNDDGSPVRICSQMNVCIGLINRPTIVGENWSEVPTNVSLGMRAFRSLVMFRSCFLDRLYPMRFLVHQSFTT